MLFPPCLTMGIYSPAFAEWMWSLASTELQWNSNKRCQKYDLFLDNNRQKVRKERKQGCLLIYYTTVSENRNQYCSETWLPVELCALTFAGQNSGQSLCDENLLVHFNCQVRGCVLRTFLFVSIAGVMICYAFQNDMPINCMRSDLVKI